VNENEITQEPDIEPGRELIQADPRVPEGHAPGSTIGLSTLQLSPKAIAVLTREVDPETEVEVRADGIVYMPAVVVRSRLDEAVGPGRWALRQERDPFYDDETKECCYDGSLWIYGTYVSRTIGGCRWHPTNKRMTKSGAIEGARSDCLRRCAKDISVGQDCWKPAWIREFIADYAEPYQAKDRMGKISIQWRKKGAPLSGESLNSAMGICGEFPLGFGPETPVPDGEHAGTPLGEIPEEMLPLIASKAQMQEWRLAAKAEIVRRTREAQLAEEPEAPTVDEILKEDQEDVSPE